MVVAHINQLPQIAVKLDVIVELQITESNVVNLATLTGQFEREIERSLRRIGEAIGPYTRFVRAERSRLTAVRAELARLGQQLALLRGRIEQL